MISKTFLFLVSLGFGANYFQPQLKSSVSFLGIPETLQMIGIMAQFQEEIDDNPITSGNGRFLDGDVLDYINFFNSEGPRCDGFRVDPPPHDSFYFLKQLEAVGNYYETISHGDLPYTAGIIISNHNNGYYTVSKEMEHYAKSDNLLAEFFTEALDSASTDIEAYLFEKNLSPDEVVFVVFHAGLGQDFSVPFMDPTVYDLKSAYIDEEMMGENPPVEIIVDEIPYDITTGILLPETQNMIYFDVVEDIFGGDDLCDIQMGITGTFAFLLGYALGLPPLFNTETGDPGVGFFGLMDHGSNNGRGVIPAPPSPFTRILAGWSSLDADDLINPFTHGDSLVKVLSAYDIANTLYRIDISEDEYFLIENRNNWVFENTSIDTMRWENKLDEYTLGHWFDVVTDSSEIFMTQNHVSIDSATNVITSFDHYDYGLPGSGILIWHITEPHADSLNSGINNDRNHRLVHLEEADGAPEIGFENYFFFASDDPTTGTHWDFWFIGNDGYSIKNPGSNAILFDNDSNPNSRSSSGAETFLSIEILDEISDYMAIEIQFDDGLEIYYLSNDSIKYLGNAEIDETVYVYYYDDEEKIYYHSASEGQVEESLFTFEPENIILGADTVYYLPDGSWIDTLGTIRSDPISPMGFIIDFSNPESFPDARSFGDLDLDGLDEIITIQDSNIVVKNSNGTLLNGFPIKGEFSGIPLVANILPDYGSLEKPEIICREGENGESIVILSNKGERLREFSSMDYDQPLALVSNWGDKIALVDGRRLLLFDQDLDHSYWLNPQSRPSGYPLSTGAHTPSTNSDFGRQKAYNYPNPVTAGKTTFRYFVSDAQAVQVRIYDAAGFLVETLKAYNLTTNEFNETTWQTSGFDAGLYLAEIKPNAGQSELVRLVLIK